MPPHMSENLLEDMLPTAIACMAIPDQLLQPSNKFMSHAYAHKHCLLLREGFFGQCISSAEFGEALPQEPGPVWTQAGCRYLNVCIDSAASADAQDKN